MSRYCQLAGCVLLSLTAAAALATMCAVRPPLLTALRNISIPIDAQMAASVLARPREPGELRVAFMSNCLFQGAVRNGDRVAKLPVELTIVGQFEKWVRDQSNFTLTLHKSGLERVLAVKPPCEARR